MQIMYLLFPMLLGKIVRKQRAKMTLHAQDVFQKQLSQVFIEFIQSDDIFKGCPITIFLGSWILKRHLIAANQCKISNLPQRLFRI